jgi:hypothetical protein
MNAKIVLAAVSVLGLAASRVEASIVVYSDFGPGQTYGSSLNDAAGSTSFIGEQIGYADPFTPTSTVTFASVVLPLSSVSGTKSLIVSLRPSVSGQPGSPLESFTVTGLPSFPTSTVYTLNSLLNPVLTAGSTYWIAIFPGGSNTVAGWNFDSVGVNGGAANVNGSATWTHNPDNTSSAFEVLGNAVPTPEPASLSMLAGLGACAAAWVGKRRRARRAGVVG